MGTVLYMPPRNGHAREEGSRLFARLTFALKLASCMFLLMAVALFTLLGALITIGARFFTGGTKDM